MIDREPFGVRDSQAKRLSTTDLEPYCMCLENSQDLVDISTVATSDIRSERDCYASC